MVSCTFPRIEPGIGREFLTCQGIRRCGVGWFVDRVFGALFLDIKSGRSVAIPFEWLQSRKRQSA